MTADSREFISELSKTITDRADNGGPTLTITFDRIGRNHDVAPLTVPASLTADDIAERVYRYARPRLASRSLEVAVDLEQGRGFNSGGTFTITGGAQ